MIAAGMLLLLAAAPDGAESARQAQARAFEALDAKRYCIAAQEFLTANKAFPDDQLVVNAALAAEAHQALALSLELHQRTKKPAPSPDQLRVEEALRGGKPNVPCVIVDALMPPVGNWPPTPEPSPNQPNAAAPSKEPTPTPKNPVAPPTEQTAAPKKPAPAPERAAALPAKPPQDSAAAPPQPKPTPNDADDGSMTKTVVLATGGVAVVVGALGLVTGATLFGAGMAVWYGPAEAATRTQGQLAGRVGMAVGVVGAAAVLAGAGVAATALVLE